MILIKSSFENSKEANGVWNSSTARNVHKVTR